MRYRDAAEQIEKNYSIGIQQRRKRYSAPVSQYQLFWSVKGDKGTIHYVTLREGLTPEQIVQVAERIASKVEIERE